MTDHHDICPPAAQLHSDGRPRVPEIDPLLAALVREHGPDGRRDIAPELRRAPPELWRHHVTRMLLLAALLALTLPAAAQQLPLPKHGNCPPGWRESGGHCVAGRDNADARRPADLGAVPVRVDHQRGLLHAARRRPALAALLHLQEVLQEELR